MSIERIEESQLRTMNGKEGIILQGCGGEPKEWLEGVNRMLNEAGIFRNGGKFDKCYVFSHKDHTCMLFPFENTELDVARLAMWRLQNYELFGGTWLSDYVPNYLGGFIEEDKEPVREKPKCALIGEDGNIFNLMGIASRTLKNNGQRAEAKEMCDRITSSGSYQEALGIIGEYVDICSKEDLDEEYDEEFDMTLEGEMC
ncbi:MAG: hypothetical protein J6I46_09940 [Ruminococcus sp.]|nr:hypothetical protein [Ruminococcus sp.]